MKKQIGYTIPVHSFTVSDKIYHVFFSRHYAGGLCDCAWFTDRKRPFGEPCKHIEVACASIKINPEVAEPVYADVPEDPFEGF